MTDIRVGDTRWRAAWLFAPLHRTYFFGIFLTVTARRLWFMRSRILTKLFAPVSGLKLEVPRETGPVGVVMVGGYTVQLGGLKNVFWINE